MTTTTPSGVDDLDRLVGGDLTPGDHPAVLSPGRWSRPAVEAIERQGLNDMARLSWAVDVALTGGVAHRRSDRGGR